MSADTLQRRPFGLGHIADGVQSITNWRRERLLRGVVSPQRLIQYLSAAPISDDLKILTDPKHPNHASRLEAWETWVDLFSGMMSAGEPQALGNGAKLVKSSDPREMFHSETRGDMMPQLVEQGGELVPSPDLGRRQHLIQGMAELSQEHQAFALHLIAVLGLEGIDRRSWLPELIKACSETAAKNGKQDRFVDLLRRIGINSWPSWLQEKLPTGFVV